MSKPDNGGPAFPSQNGHYFEPGMTLRDWFAGQSLGHIPALLDANEKNKSVKQIAEWSYQVADAMLAARNNLP